MKPVSSTSISLHLPSIALAGALALTCAGPAMADRRNPAPIVYATGTSPYPAGKPQYIEPTRAPDAKSRKEARIQFRYPDQSGARYAETRMPGMGQGTTSLPARQYASAEPVTPSQSWPSSAVAADPNSFDARAAAARIEAQRAVATIESEPLASLAPAPAPIPMPSPLPQEPVVQPVLRDLRPAAAYPVTAEAVPVFDETGIGIVYGSEFEGLPTANGEMFDQVAMTAAHPSLPLPSLIQVVNTDTGKEVVLRVNDRGPFEDGAALQVSQRAANELGMAGAGKANLRIRYLGAAPAPSAPAEQAPAPQMAAADMATELTFAAEPVSAPIPQNEYLTQAAYSPAQTKYAFTAPAPQPAAAYGDYYVQIGSFTDIANAQALSNQVQASLPVTIVPARVNGADYFRVRVGPLSSRNAAETAREELSYAGIAQGRVVTGD